MPSIESGFSLVEAMVAMAILTISAVGVGYALVSSDQQLTTVGYVSQNQQCGMTQATAMTGSVSCAGAQSTQQIITVSISAATVSSVQVPIASLSSSFSAVSNNQQPPAWWQP
jgi:prepilin-type N-terminal cleavage/methylation domain-containing protein